MSSYNSRPEFVIYPQAKRSEHVWYYINHLISLPGSVITDQPCENVTKWQKWSKDKSFSVPPGHVVTYTTFSLLFSQLCQFWMWYFLILAPTESNVWHTLQEPASLVKPSMLASLQMKLLDWCVTSTLAWGATPHPLISRVFVCIACRLVRKQTVQWDHTKKQHNDHSLIGYYCVLELFWISDKGT